MTPLEICLAIGLMLALGAVVLLAVEMPQRIAGMVSATSAHADTRAVAAKAALHAASSAEVTVIVAPLRGLLDEHARRVDELRALIAGLGDFTRAHHEQARAQATSAANLVSSLRTLHEEQGHTVDALRALLARGEGAPETTRKPGRGDAAPARPPARAPPGSAEVLPPGITPPAMAPKSEPQRIMKRAAPSAPTLLSMPSVVLPASRPVPVIVIDGEAPGGDVA